MNIERYDSNTFMIEFRMKECQTTTTYEDTSKIIIINRIKNYLAIIPTKLLRRSSKGNNRSVYDENTTKDIFFCERFVSEARQQLYSSKTPSTKLVDVVLEITSDDHSAVNQTFAAIKQIRKDFLSTRSEQFLLARVEIISQISHLLESQAHFDMLLVKPNEMTSNHISLELDTKSCTKNTYVVKVLAMDDSKQSTQRSEADVERTPNGSYQLEMLNVVDEFMIKFESFMTTLKEVQKGLIQSSRSQYTQGNVSSCVIYAAEACLRLLKGEIPTVALLDEVISSFGSDPDMEHLAITDVLSNIDRFSIGLQQREVCLIILDDLETDLRRLINNHMNYGPFGLLIVKPPEAISLIVLSVQIFIIFDSHKRNNTTGAYFDVENDARQIVNKITRLWPVTQIPFDEYADDHERYQMSLLNMCEVYVVVASEATALPPLDISQLERKRLAKEMKEQKKEIEILRRQVQDLKAIINITSNGK
ncbi:unnamed protein product [Adineta ricciae]|uniref:Uncharacterized protein n=1 Tax=Adineta ricciae TaxID=249248 RepID=A0A814S237_ADIRI|nr:unnamed protein product [Adineta ricciae]CAF1543189.1 unnamed protein product [Adineta ricciae]